MHATMAFSEDRSPYDDNVALQMINSQLEAMKILDEKEAQEFGNNADKCEHAPGNENGHNYNQSSKTSGSKKNSSKGPDTFFRRQLEGWRNRHMLESFEAGHLISKEMLEFNLEERNALYEEIHGVTCICPDESPPGMIEMALHNLAIELMMVPSALKTAYEQSQQFPVTYVNTPEFRLRFLRAELFNTKKAALRMIKFLENVLFYFGPKALQRPIRLSDFNRKEMKVMNIGRIQLLPYRDRFGRRIIVGIPAQDHRRQEAHIRVSFGLIESRRVHRMNSKRVCAIDRLEKEKECSIHNNSLIHALNTCSPLHHYLSG